MVGSNRDGLGAWQVEDRESRVGEVCLGAYSADISHATLRNVINLVVNGQGSDIHNIA